MEERQNVFAPFRLYIKIDINVLNEATHDSFIFEIREKKSSRKMRMADSRKLVYTKYLEKADSRKLVLAKCDFFDLAKISRREN